MAARIMDGRALAAELREDTAARAAALRARGVVPALAIVRTGSDAASATYARSIAAAGAKTGIDVRVVQLEAGIDEQGACRMLAQLGADSHVHGIIVQQPLPAHLALRRVAEAMPPQKDVDGAGPLNLGRLAFSGEGAFVPATPLACMLLLERSSRSLEGARACVVGRSRVVGLPVALLLLARHATVTIAHSRTRDMARSVREADVVIAAAGVPSLIRASMIKPGATVIDVGTNYVDGALCGDVAYDEVSHVAGEITPVPGGVGPVTNAALLRNVVDAAERQCARA